jgi:hypothetical protein
MSKLSWSNFIDLHPTAHLVAGIVQEADVAMTPPRQLLALMNKLLSRLGLAGPYALTVDCQGMTPEIHCVFEREADAAKVAEALQASASSRYPGWASQRTFRLEPKTRRAIESVLKE